MVKPKRERRNGSSKSSQLSADGLNYSVLKSSDRLARGLKSAGHFAMRISDERPSGPYRSAQSDVDLEWG